MKQKIDKAVISILWILTIWTLIVIFTQNGHITIRNIIAFAALISLTILNILKTKKLKSILGLILIGGTVNGLVFTPIDLNIQLGVTIAKSSEFLSLGIQPISLILLITFMLAHRKEIKLSLLNRIHGTQMRLRK